MPGSLGYMNANMNDLVSEMTFSFARRMIHEANVSSSSGSMIRGILIILNTSFDCYLLFVMSIYIIFSFVLTLNILYFIMYFFSVILLYYVLNCIFRSF